MEENIDKTEMKVPADHENTNTNENTENPLSKETNDSIIETNIDTVKQVEEEPIMTETNDIATVEQQLDDTKESTNEEAPKTYAELDQSLINMEPHFFLNKVLIKGVIFLAYFLLIIRYQMYKY